MAEPAVSVQLYSVRDAIAADLPGTLGRIGHLGFTAVEPWGFVENSVAYRGALNEHKLTAPSAHAGLLAAEEPEAIFTAATDLGIATVIEPMVSAERWATREDLRATARDLAGLAARAADLGLQVGYHNHWWELAQRIDGAPALEVFADLLDDRVVLELDTYWAAVGGVDAADLLNRLGRRVQFMHIKDGPISHDKSEQLPAGTGDMDIPAVLAAAPQARPVIEFDDYAGDIFEGLAASLAYLKGSRA